MASEMMEALMELCQEKHLNQLALIDELERSLAESYRSILHLPFGAEVIIVPEKKMSVATIVEHLSAARDRGKLSGIVVLAEGAGKADDLAAEILKHAKFSIRTSVLGHLQRGGSPSVKDRYLGTAWGAHAVHLLEQGIGNRICGIRRNKIYDMDIVEGCAMKKKFDNKLYKLAEIVAR